ncbi:MAG: hypothetical protein LBF70_01255 [Holosporales bacterium]|jgi:glucose-6-phosphate isomerase|nr:hypothetical protein [Holosporales bacterium]
MVSNISEYIKQQINSLDIFQVINEDTSYIKKIAQIFEKCEKVLIFGIGGSSLGGKCLVNFESLNAGKSPRVLFIENPDSKSFVNTLKQCDPKKTGAIVISKSGKTTEPLMLFLTLCEMWPDFDCQNKAIAITEFSDRSDLKKLAESKSMMVIEHKKSIGGRFSVFSIVGLLPALINKVDIDSFISGAKKAIYEIQQGSRIFQEVIDIGKILQSGKANQHVLMPYSDLLEDFGSWVVQLVAESLGKTSDFCVTPIIAKGTVDQHSLLQLFLGGPSDKIYTVITQKNNIETPRISFNIPTLKGHNIHELMFCHQQAIIDVLKKKAYVRVFEFDEINISTLGFLMAVFFVEVIVIAKLGGINPFDQPAVEESKNLVLCKLNSIT